MYFNIGKLYKKKLDLTVTVENKDGDSTCIKITKTPPRESSW